MTETTPEPVLTGSLPYDLSVRNFRENEVTLRTMVSANETGTVLLNETMTLDPSEEREFDLEFPGTGNYTITTVDTNGTAYEYVWNVEQTPPSIQIIVTADPRGNVTYIGSSA